MRFVEQIISAVLKWVYPFFKNLMPYEVFAYLAVGAGNTLLNIFLFVLFYQVLLAEKMYAIFSFPFESYTVALIIAFVLTVPTGFWLSKTFAFTSAPKKQNAKQLTKYFLVVLQGLLSDYLIFKFFIVVFGMHPTAAKIISTVIVLTLNYLLQKYFTFKKDKS